jgi:hypothetical protein
LRRVTARRYRRGKRREVIPEKDSRLRLEEETGRHKRHRDLLCPADAGERRTDLASRRRTLSRGTSLGGYSPQEDLMITRRAAGFALLVYGVATFVANSLIAAPGGEYEPGDVAKYVDPGHFPIAFVAAYVGCLGAVAVLPFVLGIRGELGSSGDLGWGLGVAAATTGVIGWFFSAGVDVAMAEGGTTVRDGVSHPVVYTMTEIGNLLSWCAPALFVGLVAILLSRVSTLPRWLRIFSAAAGVCGILAPFFFTYFLYLLWTLVLGATLVALRSDPARQHQESLV